MQLQHDWTTPAYTAGRSKDCPRPEVGAGRHLPQGLIHIPHQTPGNREFLADQPFTLGFVTFKATTAHILSLNTWSLATLSHSRELGSTNYCRRLQHAQADECQTAFLERHKQVEALHARKVPQHQYRFKSLGLGFAAQAGSSCSTMLRDQAGNARNFSRLLHPIL